MEKRKKYWVRVLMKKRVIAILMVLLMFLTSADVSVFATEMQEIETEIIRSTIEECGYIGEFNGHYYQVFDRGILWDDAKVYCENIGGHLATITSAEEQTFVSMLINSSSVINKCAFWLGGICENGSWKWITDEEFRYNFWYPGQPDGSGHNIQIFSNKSEWNGVLNAWDDSSWHNNAGFVCEWESVEAYKEYLISQQLSDINLGPYALKGATIEILGYEIPLIDLEANIELSLGEHLKIVTDDDSNIQVLLGFDQDAKANIDGANNSTQYWSESYREVKAMYQDLTGKKVDTTRLWNKFSSMRGKLKKMNANMVVGVDASLTGYLEFKKENGEYIFSEGGVIACFEADASLRSYYGPCYVTLGIEVGVDGSLTFVYKDNKLNPEIMVNPEFTISAGGGIGTRSTYAQLLAYGKLSTILSTADLDAPFRAGADIGVRWMGYVIGKEIFSGRKSFASLELYPNLGDKWETAQVLLMSEMDVSTNELYEDLINSAKPISRDYLISAFSLVRGFEEADFVKSNAYPLNNASLVAFEDNSMLLVWVDDLGDKTAENIGSLMYSYYDGEVWSEPQKIFEDNTANDMPTVYSDGKKAYIVWQQATTVFDVGVDTSDMLQAFDLYVTMFDYQTQTFSENVCINEEENAVFEFNTVIYGEDGSFTVAWVENTENNIYQMSGENVLHISSYDETGNLIVSDEIISMSDPIMKMKLTGEKLYYSVLEDDNLNLYSYDCIDYSYELLIDNITEFDCTNEAVFYTDAEGFHSINDDTIVTYETVGTLDNFILCDNQSEVLLFTTVLNEDFTKTLYYSRLSIGDEENCSKLEVYSEHGLYIRQYSPTVLSDGTIYVAVNYIDENIEEGTQQSHIVVERSTEAVDVEMEYVDFDDTEITTGELNLKIGLKNNSSSGINAFMVYVLDNNENIAFEKLIETELAGYEEKEILFKYTLPDAYNNEIYGIKVVPYELDELDESNNTIKTTFECVHIISEEWSIDIEPTPNTDGLISQHCQKCNKAFNEKVLPGLKFSGAALRLQNNLAIDYKIDKSFFEEHGYESPYVIFKLNGLETRVSDYSIVDGKCVFMFRNITPNQMGDTITATIYATYGDVEYSSASVDYSVSTYSYNMLEKYSSDEYAEFRTLLVDLLNYGAESQIYTDYKTNNLVNTDLTELQKAWGTVDNREFSSVMNKEYAIVDNPTVIWKGAGLNLHDSVTMRFKFTVESIDNLIIKVVNESGEYSFTSDLFEVTDGGYYLYFDGLNAGQMSESVYVTAYRDDVAVSNTICYSIESYAYSKQYDEDTNLVNLIIAMMKYGDSAHAYAN